MSIKQRLLNAISAHPKLATFGIGLAITFAIGTAIGLVEGHQTAAAGVTLVNSDNGSVNSYGDKCC